MTMTTAPSADTYGWTDDTAPHSCAYLAPEVLALLSRLKVRRVLDLGAGNGALCQALRRAGLDVVGVEQDPRGVAIARATMPDVPFYCHGVEADASVLLAEQAGFDAVVSTEVIEHLYSPHLLPRYAAAVLGQGGHLIVTTPYHGYLKNLALALAGHWDRHFTALWQGGHIKFWSRATLTQLLHDNGFEVIGFQGVGRLPWLWKSMVLIARKA
jgi:2-polyprenyl-6-hydroxyphenyl methylase/3-demethylubiquinone-9 3-methyltransferase